MQVLNLYRWVRSAAPTAVLAILLAGGRNVGQQPIPQQSPNIRALMTRVGPPSQLALNEFKKAGMEGVKPHMLTASERVRVEAALASLPALHRYVLEKRLHSLAFVDGIPGEGTGLTSPDAATGLYDITLRTSIVDEALSNFLTIKEQREFAADGSGVTVTVKGSGVDALTYVLLHESTHVVDKSCGITKAPGNPFVAGIWTSYLTLVPELASSVISSTYFRRGRPIAVSNGAGLYDALAQSPFVSLYATASEEEDFAELVAWHEVLGQHHGDLIIKVNDQREKTSRQWQPLTFAGVQKRFLEVDRLFTSRQSCSAVS